MMFEQSMPTLTEPMSQNDMVLEYLRSGRPIDDKIAYTRYGIRRLAARINDLRKRGHIIHTQILRRGIMHWAAYTLVSEQK